MDELKHSIHETNTAIEFSELKVVSSLLKRFEVCLRAEGKHFEPVL
jgi:hypothetical protein